MANNGVCHVDIPDSLITTGVFSQRLVVPQTFAIRATVDNNKFYKRKFLLIRNCSAVSTDIIQWGGPDLNGANGIDLLPGETVSFSFKNGKWLDIYLIGNNANGVPVALGEFI